MTQPWTEIPEWLPRTVAAGGLILLLGYAAVRILTRPSWKLAAAGWSVRASLLAAVLALLPAWLLIPVPAEEPARAKREPANPAVPEPFVAEPISGEWLVAESGRSLRERVPPDTSEIGHSRTGPGEEDTFAERTATPPPPEKKTAWLVPGLLALYGLGVAFCLTRLAFGQFALWRLLRRSRPAPDHIQTLFDSLGGRRARLMVTDRLAAPICFGLFRPTVLIPRGLAENGDAEQLRWVFAHELNHLRHGDVWLRLWVALAQAAYFFLPWVRPLKRELRLAQEQLADAAAVGGSPRAAEYADFLVRLSCRGRKGRLAPVAAGVRAGSSDLFRRVSMLLNESRNDNATPRRWSLLAAGGFLSLAVILGGVGFAAQAAQKAAVGTAVADDEPGADEKGDPKEELKRAEEALKQAENARAQAMKALEESLKGIPDMPPVEGLPPGFEKQFEQMRKQMEEMRKQMQMQPLQNLEGLRNFQFPGGEGQFQLQFAPGLGNQGGRLGVSIAVPSPVLVEQLELPDGRGVVISEVTEGSVAEKAGLKKNDIVMEFDGKQVSNQPAEFVKMVGEVEADKSVDIVVMRKGRKETIEGVKLPEAKAAGNFQFQPFVPGQNQPFPGFPQLKNFPKVPPVPPVPGVPPTPPKFAFPNIPPLGGGGGGEKSSQMSVQISDGNFTATMVEDGVEIEMTGTIAGGSADVESVKIKDGDKKVNVDTLKEVPEEYRSKVEKMLKSFSIE